MKNNFIGYWQLVEWYAELDGNFHSHPFGKDAKGELCYTENRRMYASLLFNKRSNFAKSSLLKGTMQEQKAAIESYLSYSGTFDVQEDKVIHHVEYSLLPNWQGTDLIRLFQFSNDKQTLILKTLPQQTSKGQEIQNFLIWKNLNT